MSKDPNLFGRDIQDFASKYADSKGNEKAIATGAETITAKYNGLECVEAIANFGATATATILTGASLPSTTIAMVGAGINVVNQCGTKEQKEKLKTFTDKMEKFAKDNWIELLILVMAFIVLIILRNKKKG